MTIDARKIEVEREPGFDRGQQRPLDDESRFSLLPLDLVRAGRPRIDRRGHRAGGKRAPQQSLHHVTASTIGVARQYRRKLNGSGRAGPP
jgi:hypothetical protein